MHGRQIACAVLLHFIGLCLTTGCFSGIEKGRKADNKELRKDAAKSVQSLPTRYEWFCEPSSPHSLACRLSSVDTKVLCGHIRITCPDGTHTGKVCTTIRPDEESEVRVNKFVPPLSDAHACTRIRFRSIETTNFVRKRRQKREVRHEKLAAELKKERDRAGKKEEHIEIDDKVKKCLPAWRKRQVARNRTEESKSYLAMSKTCQDLYWQLVKCRDKAAKLRTLDNEAERQYLYKSTPAWCRDLDL